MIELKVEAVAELEPTEQKEVSYLITAETYSEIDCSSSDDIDSSDMREMAEDDIDSFKRSAADDITKAIAESFAKDEKYKDVVLSDSEMDNDVYSVFASNIGDITIEELKVKVSEILQTISLYDVIEVSWYQDHFSPTYGHYQTGGSGDVSISLYCDDCDITIEEN